MKTSTVKIIDELFERYNGFEFIKYNVKESIILAEKAFKCGNKLLICGNGGSASDSEHIVGELMKGFVLKRELTSEICNKIKDVSSKNAEYLIKNLQMGLPAISLVSQTSLSTAFANDNASDLVFAQQVLGYGKEGDVLLVISTSGNSKNVVYAAEVAQAIGVKVIALTGQTGGKMKELCDVLVNVPKTEPYKVQELHLPYYHAFCLALENEFFGE